MMILKAVYVSVQLPYPAFCPIRKPNMIKLITRLDCKACNLCHIPTSIATTQIYRDQKFVFGCTDRSHNLFNVSCYDVTALFSIEI